MSVAKDCKTPGQLLLKLIEERGWNQRIVAIILGVGESIINKIISGHRSVDAEIAIGFESIFGVDANEFLELQKLYDLAKARIIAQPDHKRAARAAIYGDLPISEMIKRGWLDVENIKDVSKVESEILKFFNAETISAIDVLPYAALKTRTEPKNSQKKSETCAHQLIWLYRVKKIAEEMLVGDYSEEAIRLALKKLEVLMASPENVRRVPRILAECGIRYVVAETIGSAKIDGAAFWLGDASPVIGMTMRYDRIDNFWFVLRHEIEHILRLHGRENEIIDTALEGERAGTGSDVPEEERQANTAAADFGVSKKSLEKFITRKAPFFNERDVLGFANTMQVHPGIVVGRIQRETGRYDLLRHHLVKVRSKLLPSAMVDGWGDVAPIGY